MTADGTLCCAGAWTLDHLADLERQIAALPETRAGHLICDVGAIVAMDTGGAWLLQRSLSQFERRGCTISMQGMSKDFGALMQTVAQSWVHTGQYQRSAPPSWLQRLGQWAWRSADNLRNALTFIGEAATASAALLTRAQRMRWRVLLYNLQVDGLNGMPIIGLLSFLMGIVIAYQGSEQPGTGANIFIVDLVGISLREIAPLLTAILVAGRSIGHTAQTAP
jgi:phospholipid/cholesterol/gamma-HCH transport system permease protein